ncbi:MAG: PmoA family protein [Armatimonadetes bacterium]|nr:PmoA family protein [Armatimonadota bacterium]
MKKGFLVLTILVLPSVLLGAGSGGKLISIDIPSSQTGVAIPVALNVNMGDWRLEEYPSGGEVPCQLDRANGVLYFVVETPKSDKVVKKRFKLIRGRSSTRVGFSLENVKHKQLVLRENNKPVLAFNYGMILAEGVPEDRRRSCYIHPVYGPSGELLSDDFPKDHYHHRGIFWAWPIVKIGNKTYSLWSIVGIRQRFEKLLSVDLGPVYGKFSVRDGWYTDDGTKIMDEVVTVTAYRTTTVGRVVDIELKWTPVSKPITLDSSERGYGGFSMRFAPRKDTIVYTPKGQEKGDVDRVQFEWSDLSAKFGDVSEFSGVTIIDNQSNPVYPTAWSNRYYGFLNPSFTGLGPVTIDSGKTITYRYRLWVHKGNALSGNAKEAYEAYTKGVKVYSDCE